MKGITYFKRSGFSINEGYGPANIHISWFWPGHLFFFYLHLWRCTLYFMIHRSFKSVKKFNQLETK